jgi:hypothetical protein
MFVSLDYSLARMISSAEFWLVSVGVGMIVVTLSLVCHRDMASSSFVLRVGG